MKQLHYTSKILFILSLMLTFGLTQVWGQTNITSLSQITDADGHYIITQDISGGTPGVTTFNGTLEANFDPDTHMPYKITGLGAPLFTTLTGTVRNLVLEGVGISGNTGNTGAIACEANGSARIYNVGIIPSSMGAGSVSGTGYTGGLVGLLDGEARVVNCYSYADITGGTDVGGIVGHNNVATASDNCKTMVFACMFYGNITGGTSIAPIYNGTNIVNKDNKGVSNFNYFRLEAPYVQPTGVNYNCALGAEDRFLKRFEFYRHLLNSQRKLAGWWATGTYGGDEMLKWVLEPKQLDSDSKTPYPILKAYKDGNGVAIKYPSVVNIDAENAVPQTERNKGGKLGTLTVNIQMGSGGAVYAPPTGASITTSSLTLNITDKDPDHYNFNYYKVQLPYYNDVGTKNYNGNRVVTGWKIVSITGGTAGSYSTGEDVTYTDGVLTATPYNFADRNCTNKDLYSESKRVFNQGAYWDVPYGVTAITIEPYWAKCAYLADAYADVVYNTAMTSATNVPNVGGGQIFTNGNSYPIAGESQKVFTSKDNATSSSNSGLYQGTSGAGSHTVYDYAVVLVGNYHNYNNLEASMDKPYTVTSIDLDGDNEPDYSYILRFDSRKNVHPVRVDFINIPGLGMAQKSTGGSGSYNFGIMQPKGWFEGTNTSLFRVTQFEYDNKDRIAAPYILQGGVMEQWVNGQSGGHANKTTYFHVGGNVWFKEFQRGTHQDQQYDANHSPVSVTGGDFDQFHLTGLYRADATIRDDNAECYITGGRFGVVAGTGMDGLGTSDGKGNITWIIDNADIKEFYAGSFNADKPAIGNLHTIVNGGHIGIFCGGPKFGDMNSGKTVTTTATGCTFGTFFGAGYGGNSYSRQAPRNHNSVTNFPHNDNQAGNDASWNAWLGRFYKQEYNSTYGGVSTQFSYQFLPMSDNKTNVARIFVEYVKFSLATTHNVISTLKHCTVTGNFYGGGSLGKVDGSVTSTLDSCTLQGDVFGAGFSASLPPVEVDSLAFRVEPYYYEALGTYRTGIKGQTTTYTWEHKNTVSDTNSAIDKDNHILYTTEDLTTLGTVKGKVTLTIDGTSTVAGSVYGGGEESGVDGDTEVKIKNGAIAGNVYGGGDLGRVGKSEKGTDTYGTIYNWTTNTGLCTVGITGGTIAGNVFGAGKGKDDTFECEQAMARATNVSISAGSVGGNVFGGGEVGRVDQNTVVTIGVENEAEKENPVPVIGGDVFGAGAGVETHGYSALVRGNATVTIQGNASVAHSVYGGGEIAAVGRYQLDNLGLPSGLVSGGECQVNVKGYAVIGASGVGHVFGAGMGVNPFDDAHNYIDYTDPNATAGKPKRMMRKPADDNDLPALYEVVPGDIYIWEYYTSQDDYFKYLQTLALATDTRVSVEGNSTVNGSVYGGSESGFVQRETEVTVQGSCQILKAGTDTDGNPINGNVFGGGKGLSGFDKAGRVRGNVTTTISGSCTISGNVYGGGELGLVGKSEKGTDSYGTIYNWPTIKNQANEDETTGLCTVVVTGGSIVGDVFGAGKGKDDTFECEQAMARATNVSISAGSVGGNVFGGGEVGRVDQNTVVTIGVENEAEKENPVPVIGGEVFGAGAGVETHGYSALVRGNATVTIQGNASVARNVYGGGQIASVGRYALDNFQMPSLLVSGGICTVTVSGYAKIGPTNGGDVFGACRGVIPHHVYGAGHDKKDWSRRMMRYSAAFVNGKTQGTDWDYYEGDNTFIWDYLKTPEDYSTYLETLALATQPNVTIAGNASVNGDVYGGGEMGITKGGVSVNILGGTIANDVYGGGALANTNVANWVQNETTHEWGWHDATLTSAEHTTTVNLSGGVIGGNVYGGGLGRLANNDVVPVVEPIVAKVYGDVLVKLNEAKQNDDKGCVVSGYIFGCNNLNGTPLGKVTVHVYATQNANATRIANPAEGAQTAKVKGTYDLLAVYGGGNLAAYEPINALLEYNDTNKDLVDAAYTNVIIDGCDRTSIQYVYGGGNAASTPGTFVDINGTFEIGEVFGGGNGKDQITVNGVLKDNPGANVGYRDYSEVEATYDTKAKRQTDAFASYRYGSGIVQVNVTGGLVHQIYGGSNTKGNVRKMAVVMLSELDEGDEDYCHFEVDEAYGGGKSADMDGEARLMMDCVPGLKTVYGGAENADVDNNVTLNITNGRYGQVFGGNNRGGRIGGSIVVNIEETGCRPIIIGELYGGGNRAAYSIYGYTEERDGNGDVVYDVDGKIKWKALKSTDPGALATPHTSPQLNVKSFTSIGDIYGGGYGATAVMVGNPTVNINVVMGGKTNHSQANIATEGTITISEELTPGVVTTRELKYPPHTQGAIGSINNVFGGGNEAEVVGDTYVNIGTEEKIQYVTGADTTTEMPVKGVSILGNVYGGGNKANVTGQTNVAIGKSE